MALEDTDRTLGMPHWNVTRALRDYLTTQLRGPRCSDSTSDGIAVDAFNAALKRRSIAPETIAPLAVSETRPSSLLALARIDRYWQTPEARRLYEGAGRLRGPDRNPVPERVRRTDEWRNQAERLLVDIEQWTGTREAFERDYLYQKGVLYSILVDLVPPGPLRVRTIRSVVDFLRQIDRDRDARTLWFAFANRVIELAHTADRPIVIDALEGSRHPVLALYGRLARTLGSNPRASDP